MERVRELIHTRLKKLRKAARRDDGDSLHDARTAVRTLRALVRAYGEALPEKAARRAKRHMRHLLDATTEARDAEVALGKLDGAPTWLARRWHHHVKRTQTAARKVIAHEAPRIRRALKGRGDERPLELIAAYALREAADKLRTRYELARRVPTEHALHKVRLAAKHLRYLAKTIDDAPLEETLRTIQDEVGALRDERDLEHRLRYDVSRAPKALRASIASLAAHAEARADDTQRHLLATWAAPIDAALGIVARATLS